MPLLEIDDLLTEYKNVTQEEIDEQIAIIKEEFDMPEPKSDPVTMKLTDEDLSRYEEYRKGGYDRTFSYCWNIPILRPTQEEIIDYQMKIMEDRAKEDPNYFIPLASKQWDPRPRMDIMPELYGTPETSSLWNLTPESWRVLLEKIKALMDRLPKSAQSSKVLLLDNWNEWDEGHYLSPHYEGGFKYLQAVREVFTKRDNLPDYRTP